jgi:hypothetical protein
MLVELLKLALHSRNGFCVRFFLQNDCRFNQDKQDLLIGYLASIGK